MRQSLLEKNKNLIIARLQQENSFRYNELFSFVATLKEEKLIPQSKSFTSILDFLIASGLIVHLLELGDSIIERYSMHKEINVLGVANSIKPKSFFSMTTALNLQGYSTDRENYIFVSSELTPKHFISEELTQDAIDKAYKKPYRFTNNHGEFHGNHIILLSPKNTSQFEVIDFNGFRMSSINRSFVEIIVNMQYFHGSTRIIQLFKPLQSKLDVTRIFKIIEKFNFVYPYYQLFGHLLEKIGFDKSQLKSFKSKVGNLKFYTDKNQSNYLYDNYWQVFYIE